MKNELKIIEIKSNKNLCTIFYSGLMTSLDRVDLSRYIKLTDKKIVIVNFKKIK